MVRWTLMAVMFSLIAMQTVVKAQDQSEMRTSLQGCLNDAVTAGNFDKARMGRRGALVVRCTDSRRERCT
jgi:hypothetical protein